MPICHCALVKNLLYSEVNCPEVLVKKLQEGEEWEEEPFSSLPPSLSFFDSEVSNSHDFKRNWGKHLILNRMQICAMQLPKTLTRRCSELRESDL